MTFVVQEDFYNIDISNHCEFATPPSPPYAQPICGGSPAIHQQKCKQVLQTHYYQDDQRSKNDNSKEAEIQSSIVCDSPPQSSFIIGDVVMTSKGVFKKSYRGKVLDINQSSCIVTVSFDDRTMHQLSYNQLRKPTAQEESLPSRVVEYETELDNEGDIAGITYLSKKLQIEKGIYIPGAITKGDVFEIHFAIGRVVGFWKLDTLNKNWESCFAKGGN
jgi:hypothetical protein